MDLINTSKPMQLILRMIAPVAGLMPKTIMQLRYHRNSGRWVDWKNPATLQEYSIVKQMEAAASPAKLRLYADLTDKILVRDYVARRVGDSFLTKLYGTWQNPEDIDFDKLPVPCVIKTNNACATNFIVRSKSDLNPAGIIPRLSAWLKYPYGKMTGQPHYTAIKPMILAEEYLEQTPGSDELPYDYKFFCFKGEPRFILFYVGRRPNCHVTYDKVYDMDWNPIEWAAKNPYKESMTRPQCFDKMVAAAKELSLGFDFVRVDFYGIGERAVFGEMTFSPDMVTNFTPEFLSRFMREIK